MNRWRVCALFLLLLLVAPVAQAQLIKWSESTQLKWEDFKRTPPANRDTAQYIFTASKIGIMYYDLDTVLEVSVKAMVNCQESWLRPQADTSSVSLHHQQMQFWLAEVYARKLRKRISEYVPKAGEDHFRFFQNLTRENKEEMKAAQAAHHKETERGTNDHAVVQWDKEIANELQKLEDWKAWELVLRVQ